MRHGTLRGFIPHYVWAEVPRVLADRKREGGTFDLARASGCGGSSTCHCCTSWT
ncbi:hypothetical protein [Streptomyces scopuliridis]|uniref:hypothetical protein n=1 Tax=Streptomyces scopuliridis TaxID=452529 RepID=UPI0036A29762